MRRDKTENEKVIDKSHLFSEARFPALSAVEAYWHALRGNRMIPRRSEVDPRGIETALEYAFIAERIAPGMGRLRVAGSHLNNLIGMEVRGMPLGALFSLPSRRALSGCLDAVFDSPAVARIDMLAARGIGRPPLEGRMLLLPLRSDLNDVSRVLGCLSTRGSVGRTPRRFDITATSITAILEMDSAESARPARPHGSDERAATELPAMPPARNPIDDSEFSEPAAAFRHAPSTRTKVPYLRVVKTDA